MPGSRITDVQLVVKFAPSVEYAERNMASFALRVFGDDVINITFLLPRKVRQRRDAMDMKRISFQKTSPRFPIFQFNPLSQCFIQNNILLLF